MPPKRKDMVSQKGQKAKKVRITLYSYTSPFSPRRSCVFPYASGMVL